MTAPYMARILAATPSPVAQEMLLSPSSKSTIEISLVREAAISGLSGTAILFDKVNQGPLQREKLRQMAPGIQARPAEADRSKNPSQGRSTSPHLSVARSFTALRQPASAAMARTEQDYRTLAPSLTGPIGSPGARIVSLKILIHGLTGPIHDQWQRASLPSPSCRVSESTLRSRDGDIADISTFIRANWTNRAARRSAEATVTESP